MVIITLHELTMINIILMMHDDDDDDDEDCICHVVSMEHICQKRYSITKKSCLKVFEAVPKRKNGNVMHSIQYNT